MLPRRNMRAKPLLLTWAQLICMWLMLAARVWAQSTGPSASPLLDVWLSPRMPMAMREWPRMHAVAREMGFEVRIHRDPQVGEAEWAGATAASAWPMTVLGAVMTSSLSKPVVQHFPTAIITSAGSTTPHPWPLQGVMPNDAWRRQLQLRLTQSASLAPQAAPQPSQPLAGATQACIAPIEYLAIHSATPLAELGAYERISPDGRFVLRSFSGAQLGQVTLVELPAPQSNDPLRYHATPLRNEAFPVQGTWRFLVDVDGSHHRFTDVLRQGILAKPLFKGGMTGFYAAASEMPGTVTHIRSLSWPQPDAGIGDDAAIGPLQLRTLAIQDDWPQSNRVTIRGDSGPQFLCGHRSAADGDVYALPMIAVNGLEFSAVPQSPRQGAPSMRSYSLSPQPMARQHPCQLTHDLGAAPGKAVYGFVNAASSSAWLAYTDNAAVHVLDRRLNTAIAIAHTQHRVLASAFPGITTDGRVIFAATWHTCEDLRCPPSAGYVIVDPLQQPGYQALARAHGVAVAACISPRDVALSRRDFAQFHQLTDNPKP